MVFVSNRAAKIVNYKDLHMGILPQKQCAIIETIEGLKPPNSLVKHFFEVSTKKTQDSYIYAMKKAFQFFAIFIFWACVAQVGCAQNTTETKETTEMDIPFATIAEYPETYTPATIVCRAIEGLGYRYHWASKDLRAEDLEFAPNEEARSTFETLVHIFELSVTIRKTIDLEHFENLEMPTDFDALRMQTLVNLQKAAVFLRENPTLDLTTKNIVFGKSDAPSKYPFWHLLNGQIEDAVWHVGQVVSFRRSSGNPLPKGTNVFSGK